MRPVHVACYCRKCVGLSPRDKQGNPFPAAGRQICLLRYLPGGKFAVQAKEAL